jgi:hypothetical protein
MSKFIQDISDDIDFKIHTYWSDFKFNSKKIVQKPFFNYTL